MVYFYNRENRRIPPWRIRREAVWLGISAIRRFSRLPRHHKQENLPDPILKNRIRCKQIRKPFRTNRKNGGPGTSPLKSAGLQRLEYTFSACPIRRPQPPTRPVILGVHYLSFRWAMWYNTPIHKRQTNRKNGKPDRKTGTQSYGSKALLMRWSPGYPNVFAARHYLLGDVSFCFARCRRIGGQSCISITKINMGGWE